MANKVVLEQKVDPFKNLSPVLNPILDGLTTFGNNFSVVAGTLIDFFTVTKIFLTAIRNPLAGPLLNTIDALIAVLEDLSQINVDIVTIGQYLRPTAKHRPIHRYVEKEEFDKFKSIGESLGIPHIESGPLVRSSYHAKDSFASV